MGFAKRDDDDKLPSDYLADLKKLLGESTPDFEAANHDTGDTSKGPDCCHVHMLQWVANLLAADKYPSKSDRAKAINLLRELAQKIIAEETGETEVKVIAVGEGGEDMPEELKKILNKIMGKVGKPSQAGFRTVEDGLIVVDDNGNEVKLDPEQAVVLAGRIFGLIRSSDEMVALFKDEARSVSQNKGRKEGDL